MSSAPSVAAAVVRGKSYRQLAVTFVSNGIVSKSIAGPAECYEFILGLHGPFPSASNKRSRSGLCSALSRGLRTRRDLLSCIDPPFLPGMFRVFLGEFRALF